MISKKINTKEIYDYILESVIENRIPEKASAMKAYMKNQFEYAGLPSPQRKELVKKLKSRYNLPLNDEFFDLVKALWQDPYRELKYIALDILEPKYKYMNRSHVPFIQSLMLDDSWWDTIDGLAPKGMGTIFKNDVEIRNSKIEEWINSNNKWLKRSCIIHQLTYKENVDEELLYSLIQQEVNNKEFFVQKACGWALRQYSKFNPLSVKQFVNENPNLSGLCKREASKYLA